ncbi:MAG: bifunctional DNA-formamidopyrimidine glycosylase/DNA-(apurinic or apyrimidinic site) lyase [Mangrovicoccus sp.]
MPELPEVETVRQGLRPYLEGHRISHADIRRPDLRWPFPDRMAERLTGARILTLRRRSKYLLADLDSQETLLIHLGMSGRMIIFDPQGQSKSQALFHTQNAPDKHDHVILHFDNGHRVVFNDPRRFGAMDLIETPEVETHKLLASLGPEPFGNQFNESYAVDRLKTRNTPIKTALLDQKFVAGLGNIYVCEVLFRAGVSPKRKAKDISSSRLAKLVPIIRDVLQEAIAAGGSSLKDFRQADGDLGYFQHAFQVYGREGEPCKKTGCGGTVARISQSGRSSFYCSACQR